MGDSLLNLPSHISSPLPRLPRVDTPAFWAFLWFVGFCYLANQWQVSKPKDNPLNEGTDAARAAIAFSFFSIFTWVSTPPSWPPLACPAGPPGAGGLSAEPGTLFSLPPQCLQGEGGNCSPRKKTAAIASGDRQVVTTDPAFGVVTGSPPSHSSIWVVESCCPLLQMRNLRPRGQDKASRFYTGKEPRLRGDLGQTLGPPLIFWASICPSVK